MAEIRVDQAAEDICRKRFGACQIPLRLLEEWGKDAEFDLDENPNSKLEYIPAHASGKASYHQYKSSHSIGHRTFQVVWDLDWDKSENIFHLLDIHPIQRNPPPVRPMG